MSSPESYSRFFSIDPDYFPIVNEAVIREHRDLWKKFYPHETFVRLLRNCADVLERKQKKCLWVEGAYGTGKSHAVLTLKSLLEASEGEMRGYFEQFSEQLGGKDLFNRLLGIRAGGHILCVHRYGSSGIQSDHNLIVSIQESVEESLLESNLTVPKGALRNAMLEWLSDEVNLKHFDNLIQARHSSLFGGADANEVIEQLKNYTGDPLLRVMENIFYVAAHEGLNVLKLEMKGLCEWLKEVIEANNLKALLFIWDEFTEYFKNNGNSLTGFQMLCELSATAPFYLAIITHESQSLFGEKDSDFKKLNDRFVSPHCAISLPSTIAFQLMGAALTIKKDPEVEKSWANVKNALAYRTRQSRKAVEEKGNLPEREVLGVLPIHPYAAAMLHRISSVFNSNQRSMFDFIKHEQGDEIKGFQWFIQHHGDGGEHPFLTVDMLWEFFYEGGRDKLAREVRDTLDYYYYPHQGKLARDEQRVLKAILLLHAVSLRAGNAVELLLPNKENIQLAFEGSDLEQRAVGCARKLVRDKVLYESKDLFAIYSGDAEIDITPYVERINNEASTKLIQLPLSDGPVGELISLSGALKLRYEIKAVTSSNFDSTLRDIRNGGERYKHKIVALACFAKDTNEARVIAQKIRDHFSKREVRDSNIIFIDTTLTPLGEQYFAEYRDYMARASAHQGKDNAQANQHTQNGYDVLKQWKGRIANGELRVFASEYPSGERVASLQRLDPLLEAINRIRYPRALESLYHVIDNMYVANSLPLGVECGCREQLKGTYQSSNPNTKLDVALKEAWGKENYWEKGDTERPISKLKGEVDGIIKKGFDRDGRVAIREVYQHLEGLGFMPCNLTAFITGFLLKEYTLEYCQKYGRESYSYYDGLTSDDLTVDRLKTMVDEVIKLSITPNDRYRDKYIVALTPEEKAFNELTAKAFGIPPQNCTSIPDTTGRVREKMKGLGFPIWPLRGILDGQPLKADRGVIERLITHYCEIVNTANPNDCAMRIGRLVREHPAVADDLQALLTKERCQEGMAQYVAIYREGRLVALATEIQDGNGQYLNAIRAKFNAEESTWLWNAETVDRQIDRVILEYEIVAASNGVVSPATTSFASCIREWCDRCNQIRLSYEASKRHLEEVGELLALLLEIKRRGELAESSQERFLTLLQERGEAFRAFYQNQTERFKRTCSFDLQELEELEIEELYQRLPSDCFTMESSRYLELVAVKVKEFKQGRKINQLKELWLARTHSETPQRWSREQRMPILALVPDEEIERAKKAFAVLNQGRGDESEVNKALEYLEAATFFKDMDDSATLERVFRAKVIDQVSPLLEDLEEVKAYLLRTEYNNPYDWFDNKLVTKKLNELALDKYRKGGFERAVAAIANMASEEVKRYLQELIRENMTVGLEIIKENEEGNQ